MIRRCWIRSSPFGSPLAPRTVFRDIVEVPPGHYLLAREGKVTVKNYWQINFAPAASERSAKMPGRLRGRVFPTAGGCRQDSLAGGRAGGSLFERRTGFVHHRLHHPQFHQQPLGHLFHRLRRCQFRRERLPAPDGRIFWARNIRWSRPLMRTSAGFSRTLSGTRKCRSCEPRRRRCFCCPNWCGTPALRWF